MTWRSAKHRRRSHAECKCYLRQQNWMFRRSDLKLRKDVLYPMGMFSDRKSRPENGKVSSCCQIRALWSENYVTSLRLSKLRKIPRFHSNVTFDANTVPGIMSQSHDPKHHPNARECDGRSATSTGETEESHAQNTHIMSVRTWTCPPLPYDCVIFTISSSSSQRQEEDDPQNCMTKSSVPRN